MRKYTEKEVEFLLEKQREQCAFALSIRSETFMLPQDLHKVNELIMSSKIVNYDENLKYFKKH